MEEFDLEKEQQIAGNSEEIASKSPVNSQRKAPNEKRSTIIIGAIATLLVLSVTGTFIGASIYEKNNSQELPTPSFTWDVDRSGFFDKDGNFLDAGKSYKFVDKTDDADRKYIQITSVEAPKDAYAYVFPSYLNNMTGDVVETLPIYSVGKPAIADAGPDKTSVFGDTSKNKGIAEVYFQSLYKEIRDYAFNNCVDLERVEFRTFATGKQTIGSYAFANCAKLKNVVLSNNLNQIGSRAFENDACLETIAIPNSLTRLDDFAFNGTALKDIYYSGTKANWEKITKTDNWSGGLSDCKIHFLEEGLEETI